ncbi:MAG: glycosyltransferase family 2 protein [bacterium]|nr:glycosyltransferase family 2 protein [bacterium]
MIAVIILSYHAPADLRRCLESVLRTEFPSERFRIVVVDNAATAETAAVLQEYVGRIDVLPQRANTGYAGGMNIGIRHARDLGAKFVTVLNQDTEVDPNWLRHLVMAMESDPAIGAVQARIMYGEPVDERKRWQTDAGLVQSVGNAIHPLGFGSFGFAVGAQRACWSDVRRTLRGYPCPEVTYPSGAAVMYRMTALSRVGFAQDDAGDVQFFDEAYFLYHEDTDLGVRLWLCGFRCVLAPQSVVVHHYDFGRSTAKMFYMERNRIRFLLENFRVLTLLVLAPALCASEVALFVFAWRGGWGAEKVRAWRDLLRPATWRSVLRHRAAKQAARRMPDRVVTRRFIARFANPEVRNALVERAIDPIVACWWRAVRPLIVW